MHWRLHFLFYLQAFNLTHAIICDETLLEQRGADYRGCQDHTREGLPCQAWVSQYPHTHDRTPENYPFAGLLDGGGTYCRNPDGEPSIWCYTMDPDKRWGICEPLTTGEALTMGCPAYSCGEDVSASSDECLQQFAALACPVLEGSMTLTQVTSLAVLAELSIIKGNLKIVANPALTSLTGLEKLTEVNGELTVKSNAFLRDMRGLDNLRLVGSLKIFGCEQLEELTGLNKLASVTGDLWIDDCRSLNHLGSLTSLVGEQSFSLTLSKCNRLQSLHGLEGITSLGEDDEGNSLWLDELPLLTSLSGLGNLRGSLAGGILIRDNPMLQSIDELHGITAVGKSSDGSSIRIKGNTQLVSVRGLRNIVGELPGSLSLESCQALKSLDGLQGMISIGTDEDGRSLVLRSLGISSITELANVTGSLSGSIEIASNSELQSLDGLHRITNVGQATDGPSLFLLSNEQLQSISGLRGLRGNLPGGLIIKSMRSLTSLNGLEGITSLGRVKEDNSARLASFGDCSGYSICLVDMQSLVTIAALSSISGPLPGALKVNRCHALKSLTGLGGITSLTAHEHETTYAIWIEANKQLESIAALGTLEQVVKVVQNDVQDASILIHSCPALKSLQGIEEIFDPVANFFQISIPDHACYDPSGDYWFTKWNRQSCKDCQPDCGVDAQNRSIECDYAIGACRCPLGWSGPGCVNDVSKVEIVPDQHVTCHGPVPGSPQEHVRCTVSVQLTRQILPTGNVSAARSLMPYVIDISSDDVTLEPESTRIQWLNDTEGRLSFDLLISLDDHGASGRIGVGYDAVLQPDCILTGTITETEAPTGLRSYPWPACLDAGTCLVYSNDSFITVSVLNQEMLTFECTKGWECTLDFSDAWGSLSNVPGDFQGADVMAVQSSVCPSCRDTPEFGGTAFFDGESKLEVQFGQVVNSSYGNYRVCLCNNTSGAAKEIGQLMLSGPGVGSFECSIGRPCNLTFEGQRLQAGDSVGIFESCGQAAATSERVVEGLTFAGFGGLTWSRNGWFFRFSQRTITDKSRRPESEPGIFVVCWCRPNDDDDCQQSKRSYGTLAGYITVQGPYSLQRFLCQLGSNCNVTLRGVGLEGGRLVMQKNCSSQVSMTYVLNSSDGEGTNFVVPALDLGSVGPQQASLCWCKGRKPCVNSEDFAAKAASIDLQCPTGYFEGSSLCVPCPPGGKCIGGNAQLDCEAGWYLDSDRCILCDSLFAPIWAADDASGCIIDAARMVGLLVSSICIIGAMTLLPIMLGLNIPIEDIRKEHQGVVVKTNIQHLVRSSRHRWERRACASFFDTGIPWLNAPAKYAVKPLNAYQLLLLDASGEGVKTDMDSSIGYLRLTSYSALCLTAVLLPLWLCVLVLIILCLTAYVLLSVPVLSVIWQLPVAVVISAALHVFRQRIARYTPLRKQLQDFEKKLKDANPKPVPVPSGPGRALKASAILDLQEDFQAFIGSRSMYYVCPNLVLPLTQQFRLSYSEMAGPTEVEWFCSHYWGHPFQKTVASVKTHAEKLVEARATYAKASDKSWAHAAYWICTFSNNQHLTSWQAYFIFIFIGWLFSAANIRKPKNHRLVQLPNARK